MHLINYRVRVGPGSASPKVIQRSFLLQRPAPAMMAALILTVIGGYDHVIPQLPPARDEGGKHFIRNKAGVIHLLTIVKEPMAHTVQRAGVQNAVIQPEAQAQIGQGLNHTGPHPTGSSDWHFAIAGHGVEPTVVDGHAVRLVIFNIADIGRTGGG